MSPPTPKVFISYRREETAGHAGRLYDAMVARMGEGHVFVDVDLAPGVDFVDRIQEAIGSCSVLLVIMGSRWAVLADEKGVPRIADPEDFVRLEVETALRRRDLTVIPVLVGGAEMPDPDDLPEGVRPLTRRNAIELSDMRWRYDVGRLHTTLDELLSGSTGLHQTAPAAVSETASTPQSESTPEAVSEARAAPLTPQASRRVSPAARLFIDAILVAGVAGLLARWFGQPIDPKNWDSDAGQIIATMLRRGIIFAVVGVAIAVWISYVRGEVRSMGSRALLGLGVGALAGAVGGAIAGVSQYVPDPRLSPAEIENISIVAFAASGCILGGLIGALWSPRKIAAGLLVGLVAGAIARVFWVKLAGGGDGSAFQDSLGWGIQMLIIVGLVLATLQALTIQRSSALAGPRGSATA